MDKYNFLDELKPGDEVIVCGNKKYIAIVARTTKTQIILKGSDARYSKYNGCMRGGDSWHQFYLKQCTKEIKTQIIQENTKRMCGTPCCRLEFV